MKRLSMWSSLRAFSLLALALLAHQASAQVLNNDRLRFGDGAQNSVNVQGNLMQPHYYGAASSEWWPLTYSSYALDNAVGINGTGASEWNIDGNVVANPALTNQTIDSSGFVPVSGNVGYGTLISTGTLTINGSTLEMRNTYELGATSSYVARRLERLIRSAATASSCSRRACLPACIASS